MTHKVQHTDGSEDWDWDIQQAVNEAIAAGQIPELEDTVPKPDYIKEGVVITEIGPNDFHFKYPSGRERI